LGKSKTSRRKNPPATRSLPKLTPEEKEALGKTGEVELRAGIELLSADKKRVMELVSIVDPPVPL